ncbi:MAG: class II aldolase/adducin family protein [Treponema sp.]|nr:class II aldolase/adducin family protein [Treponema sp.]
MTEQETKELICEIGSRTYKNGFVVANDGNITVRLNEQEYLTTPTGVSKGYMTPDMIVKVNENGEKLTGSMEPSSEVKVHLCIYRHRPDVNAVVHAHPPYATVFAVTRTALDKYIMPEAATWLGAIPSVPYARPSSVELAEGLIPYLPKYNCFLLENHGTVTVGPDLMAAYFKTEQIEFYAKVLYLVMGLGSGVVKELPKEKIEDLIKHFTTDNSFMHPGYVKF